MLPDIVGGNRAGQSEALRIAEEERRGERGENLNSERSDGLASNNPSSRRAQNQIINQDLSNDLSNIEKQAQSVEKSDLAQNVKDIAGNQTSAAKQQPSGIDDPPVSQG